MTFKALTRRIPRPADLAINAAAVSLDRYDTDVDHDVAAWLDSGLELAENEIRELQRRRPREAVSSSPSPSDRESPRKRFREVITPHVIAGYQRWGWNFGSDETIMDSRDPKGVLGLLAISTLWNTEQFWVKTDHGVAREGERWGAAADLMTPGHPHMHYLTTALRKIIEDLPGGEHKTWYRDDESGLFLTAQTPATPSANYGFDVATHSTVTPYLPSPAALNKIWPTD